MSSRLSISKFLASKGVDSKSTSDSKFPTTGATAPTVDATADTVASIAATAASIAATAASGSSSAGASGASGGPSGTSAVQPNNSTGRPVFAPVARPSTSSSVNPAGGTPNGSVPPWVRKFQEQLRVSNEAKATGAAKRKWGSDARVQFEDGDAEPGSARSTQDSDGAFDIEAYREDMAEAAMAIVENTAAIRDGIAALIAAVTSGSRPTTTTPASTPAAGPTPSPGTTNPTPSAHPSASLQPQATGMQF